MPKLDVYDYVVFSLVLIISLLIGLYHAFQNRLLNKVKFCFKKNRQIKRESQKDDDRNLKSEMGEYLIASSSMGAFPVALSLLATFFSAIALLGTPAEIYLYGIQYYISTFGMMITPLIGLL